MDNNKTDKPKNVLPDLIIPVMALSFAIYYLTTITEVPWIAQASAIVVSGLLFLSIFAFAIRTVMRLRTGTEYLQLKGLIGDRSLMVKRIGLLLLTVSYVWIIDVLGFTLTTLVFLFLAIVWLSSLANWRRALVVSLSCSLIGYVVFIFIFDTRFPKGPVEIFVERITDGS